MTSFSFTIPGPLLKKSGEHFQILHQDTHSSARLGLLRTVHGSMETPVFMMVGTQGTVKTLSPAQLQELKIPILLGNTYHLGLRPGSEQIAKLGGLHRFMGWSGPILTDSGGFQVFSLGKLNQINDEGAFFRSHVDGKLIAFTPEFSMKIQRELGSDICMVFDHCPPYPCTESYAREAVHRTIHWAERCLGQLAEHQYLYGIVQGSVYRFLREECAQALKSFPLDGYAIGGVAVGEEPERIQEVVAYAVDLLPYERPHYLMGVGTPKEMLMAIGFGIDMFDCVIPTRNARGGLAFTFQGKVRIRNNIHASDPAPLETSCKCYTCQNFSRAYLHHLFNVRETLGLTLMTFHNAFFFQEFFLRIRQAIQQNTFRDYAKTFLAEFQDD